MPSYRRYNSVLDRPHPLRATRCGVPMPNTHLMGSDDLLIPTTMTSSRTIASLACKCNQPDGQISETDAEVAAIVNKLLTGSPKTLPKQYFKWRVPLFILTFCSRIIVRWVCGDILQPLVFNLFRDGAFICIDLTSLSRNKLFHRCENISYFNLLTGRHLRWKFRRCSRKPNMGK